MKVRRNKPRVRWLIATNAILALISNTATGDSGKSGISDSLPAGVVYPGFTTAIGINPAGLTGRDAIATEAFFSPAIWGSSEIGAGIASCAAFDSFALGVNLGGISVPQSPASYSWTGAGAFRMQNVSLGFSVNSYVYPGQVGTGPLNLNLGLTYGERTGSGLTVAGVLGGLNGVSSTLTLGVGYGEQGKYHLEFDLQLPALSTLFNPGTTYGLLVGGAIYAGIFGASFSAVGNVTPVYPAGTIGLSSFSLTETISLMLKFSSQFSLSLYFTGASASGIPGAEVGMQNAPTFGVTYSL